MPVSLKMQLVYMVRILAAGVCGVCIGYERESHMKFAGIRTHAIVSIASSLMMVISKYGFFDVMNRPDISLDPSRIAAGIVTAIGFLGAGVIFIRKKTINGLTTGAGIWATVGVGMAIGTGFYLIGAASTLIIVVIQILLDKKSRLLRMPVVKQIDITFRDLEESLPYLIDQIKGKHMEIINIQSKRIDADTISLKLFLKIPREYDLTSVLALLRENPDILTIDI